MNNIVLIATLVNRWSHKKDNYFHPMWSGIIIQCAFNNLLDDALRLGLAVEGGCPSTPPCGEAPRRQLGPPAWSPLKLPTIIVCNLLFKQDWTRIYQNMKLICRIYFLIFFKARYEWKYIMKTSKQISFLLKRQRRGTHTIGRRQQKSILNGMILPEAIFIRNEDRKFE